MDLRECAQLTTDLMEQHGLDGWRFQYDRARLRFGQCRHTSRVISLSAALVGANEESVVRDTILHEIAHALCGPSVGHGPEWKRTAAAIGARPERCYGPDDVQLPPAPYYLVCLPCDFRWPRHRRTRNTYTHRRCGGRMTWEVAS